MLEPEWLRVSGLSSLDGHKTEHDDVLHSTSEEGATHADILETAT